MSHGSSTDTDTNNMPRDPRLSICGNEDGQFAVISRLVAERSVTISAFVQIRRWTRMSSTLSRAKSRNSEPAKNLNRDVIANRVSSNVSIVAPINRAFWNCPNPYPTHVEQYTPHRCPTR